MNFKNAILAFEAQTCSHHISELGLATLQAAAMFVQPGLLVFTLFGFSFTF